MSNAPLHERPAAHLRRLMLEEGAKLGLVDSDGNPRPVSHRVLAAAVWDGQGPRMTSLIRSWLDGRQTRWPIVVDVAEHYGVDPGLFYQELEP